MNETLKQPQDERTAPRLPLSLPGEFIGTAGNQRCILTDLSRDGARIALREPVPVGSDGYLRVGPIDHFMTVVRVEKGGNALVFDNPVADVFVANVRRFQATLAEREETELRETALRWASGRSSQGY